MTQIAKENLQKEIEKLHARNELSKNITENYFEPGMMEFLEQSEGLWNKETGEILIRFEAKGTRYEGRTEQIEKLKVGDNLQIVRDNTNKYNQNNFKILARREQNVGNLPAELCNAMAPLYDNQKLMINDCSVSYVEPISKRSRHASQAILFVEVKARLID